MDAGLDVHRHAADHRRPEADPARQLARLGSPTRRVFEWQGVPGGVRYQIQIDNNDTFASPVQDAETPTGRHADLHRQPDAGRRQVLLAGARHQQRRRGGGMERRPELHAYSRWPRRCCSRPSTRRPRPTPRPRSPGKPSPTRTRYQFQMSTTSNFRHAGPPGQRHPPPTATPCLTTRCRMANTSGGCAA